MAGRQQDRMQSIIEGAVCRDNLCQWCHYPFERPHWRNLCRHCFDIRRELVRLHKQYAELIRKVGGRILLAPPHIDLKMRYATVLMMAEHCQSSGHLYRNLPSREISGLDLAFQLDHLSRRLISKDLYSHLTHWLDAIPASERRYFYFLLSLLSEEYDRRHRREIAFGLVYNKTVEEVLAERAHHSFRVEDA